MLQSLIKANFNKYSFKILKGLLNSFKNDPKQLINNNNSVMLRAHTDSQRNPLYLYMNNIVEDIVVILAR